MFPFDYKRPDDLKDALASGAINGAHFIGGGTNLLDLMKSGITRPAHIVDINHLQLDGIDALPGGGLRIGAAARNSDVANHALVLRDFPLLSQALLAGASAQLRNMATVGGNLMQRTRCDYFVDPGFARCNKRNPGSGCGAIDGFNRLHALFGASPQCVAVNPSDMNVALLTLDATVNVRSNRGERRIPIAQFHRLPGDVPQRDTILEPGELIVAVDLPHSKYVQHHHYLKVRERASYAFALVSVGVGLDIADGVISNGRIALGGVAHRPWYAERASAALAGKKVDAIDVHAVAAIALDGAQPLSQNAYKIPLAKNAVERALRLALENT
jgi:xanthine dehydrogenase YagS FAD-binding subunit